MALNNLGLVKFAEYMVSVNAPYWFGTYGQIGSEKVYQDCSERYKSQYEKWSKESFVKQYGQKVADCSGLIKAYCMSPCVDANGYVTEPSTPSVYNSKYDLSADMLMKKATEKGHISTIPEIKGIIVWKEGHVGIYAGGGIVYEEKGHASGCVRSKLKDRPFTHWLKHPMIEYISEDPEPKKRYCKPIAEVLTKGDQGTAVKVLQSCLNLQGYSLSVDGHYGNKTDEAVRDFQSKNKIKNAGTVGVRTWDKIIK